MSRGIQSGAGEGGPSGGGGATADEIATALALGSPLPISGAQLDALIVRLEALVDVAGGLLTESRLRAAPLAVTGPATNAELRAGALAVTGPATNAELRAAALVVTGPATNAEMRAAPLPVAPLLTQGQNVARDVSAVLGGTPTSLLASGAQACKQVTVYSDTSVGLYIFQATGGSAGAWTFTGAIGIPLPAGSSPAPLFGISDVGQVGITRADATAGAVNVRARWEG